MIIYKKKQIECNWVYALKISLYHIRLLKPKGNTSILHLTLKLLHVLNNKVFSNTLNQMHKRHTTCPI